MSSANAVKLLFALVCATVAVPTEDVLGKPRRPDLTLGKVRVTGTPAPGATVKLRLMVRNRGTRRAPRSQLSVGLQGMRSPLARKRVKPIRRGRTAKLALSIRLPTVIAPGRYRIVACADAARKAKELRETNNCRTASRGLTVDAVVPAPVPPGGTTPPIVLPGPPAPTPTPTATATATATATPTATATATATPTATPDGEVPPEDLPPLNTSVPDRAETLYDEQGVDPGAIAEQRAGILHGRTVAVNGDPLAGVRVRVHDHPELGSTTTGADGEFDLAVNGGAQITLEYTRAGNLEVQRDVDPTQRDWTNPPEVVMLASDPAGQILDPPDAGGWTTARATPQTDSDGTRTSTLLFAPGTTATMRFANGSTQPLPGPWTVRQTEYTSVTSSAMPAELPPTSGYTYAAELAIDEADAAGADSVELTAASGGVHAAVNYVENFIGAPVGADVPTGAYDRTSAEWEGAPDGRVVKVISESAGMANLDTDGDGDSDPDDYPAALKLTDGERTTLAPLYAPGDELLRVPIPHLSPWDHNWPYAFPPGAGRPRLGPDGQLIVGCPEQGSSTIDCENQTLTEAVDVAGTPYRLSYSSDWEPGGASRSFDVEMTPPTLPEGLLAVELKVQIAGQLFVRRYADPAVFPDSGIPPIAPGIVDRIAWDGLDAFGEPVEGAIKAQLTLNYYYQPFRYETGGEVQSSWAQFGSGSSEDEWFGGRIGCSDISAFGVDATSDLCAFRLTTEGTRTVGSAGRGEAGLGGWDLDAHHVYDAQARAVRLGDGTTRQTGEIDVGRMKTVAGRGAAGSSDDDIERDHVGVLPDGSVLTGNSQGIFRTPAGEASELIAGMTGTSFERSHCDGRDALGESLSAARSMAVRPDGTIVLAMEHSSGGQICEVTPDGKLVLIGGAQTVTCPSGDDCRGDGGPAEDAPIHQPDSLTIAADGSIYFVETAGATNGQRKLVRRIDPTGVISTVAGGGDPEAPAVNPDGEPAVGSAIGDVRGLLAMPDGSVLMADTGAGLVTEIQTNGVLRRYAGTFGETTSYVLDIGRRNSTVGGPRALALGRDGSVFVLSAPFSGDAGTQILRIRPDGVVARAVGFSTQEPCPAGAVEGESAVDHCPLNAFGLAVDGDGNLLFSEIVENEFTNRVRRVEPALGTVAPEGSAIPSKDGSEVWLFDGSGRHLRTVDGLTGATVLEFGYDAAGRLLRIEDGDGRKTFIERNGAGAPTAILAPDGRRTTLSLNGGGRLSTITNPMGEARGLTYGGGGRLTGQQLPSGKTSSYSYDSEGRLIGATGAAGQTRELDRIALSEGHAVEVTTGEGRVTRYTVLQTEGGGVHRIVRRPSGSVTELDIAPDGTRTLTLPSGETRRTASVSDPRFGASLSVPREHTTTAPSGKSVTLKWDYDATLTSAGNPFNPTALTTDVTGPHGVTHQTYDGAARTLKTTTPAGRQNTTTFDARGRPVRVQVGDPAAPNALAPTTAEYDAGKVSKVAQGNHVTRYEYDMAGRRTAAVAADGGRVEHDYDDADRLIETRYPGGRTYRYGVDEDGELTSRQLPSARTHTFAPTGLAGQISSWTPPGATGSYAVARDDDELTSSVTTPTGATRTVGTDAAGRVTGAAFPAVGRSVTYVPGVDRIGRYESTAAPGSAVQSLEPEFDGMRVTKLTADGLAPAETTWAYGASLRMTSSRLVSGADDVTLAYTRDADGLPTAVGPFTHERTGPDHSLSAITDGTGRTEESVDDLAELDTRRLTVGGAEKYRLELTMDATGRVTGRREVDPEGDHTFAYTHNALGELAEVRRDGTLVESYGYDADGDRTTQGATYDAAGRLTSRNGISYTFDDDGFLAARGADSFTYARSGELRSATVGGTPVSYAYDGMGRMVARVQAGDTTRYVYGDPDFAYRVSAARAPDGTLDRYLYGPRGNLYAILRGGARFHVGTDQVGSPRVVVAADGTVVKRLEYSAYGVTTDHDPGFFLPFGYAGGLRDPVTGLVRFGLRDYEPQSGRFTARDPAMFEGSPRSLYGYANNSPVSYHDPGGTASLSVGGYLGGGGGATFYFDPSAFFDLDKPLITGLCVEAGLGVGGGTEADFLEQPPTQAGLSAFAELNGVVPGASGKFGGEFDLICGTGKFKSGANVLGLQSGYDSSRTPSAGLGPVPAGFKIEGKAGFKACLPPPPR